MDRTIRLGALALALASGAGLPVVQGEQPVQQPAKQPAASMEPRSLDVPAFAVIGLTARTTNKLEMSGEGGKIGPLWQAFLHGSSGPIPGVIDATTIYSVYTNYESDHNGPYDVILGRSVSDPHKASRGMKGIAIPRARYLVFPATGNTPDAIRAAWAGVYKYFSAAGAPRRAFTVDFERYSTPDVNLYIAVR